MRMPADKLKQLRNAVHGEQQETNQVMKQSIDAAVFVDIQTLICNSENNTEGFAVGTALPTKSLNFS